MSRIGIFGGSFNPIHNGHIALARQLRQLARLDEVWLMVSPQNPLKQSSTLLDDQLRYDLARQALQGEEGLKACDYEFQLPKPSYTWDTLQHLSKDYPQHTFILIIGGDNWSLFPKWYRSDDIISHYPIVIYPRRGSDIDLSALPPTVSVAQTELLDISSTEIRQRIRQGRCIRQMVPAAIVAQVQACYAKFLP